MTLIQYCKLQFDEYEEPLPHVHREHQDMVETTYWYLHPRRGAQCVNLKGNSAAPM